MGNFIIAESFKCETGLYYGDIELTLKGEEVLKTLSKGQDVCVEADDIDETESYSIYLKFISKDTIRVEYMETHRYNFRTYDDSPPECSEYNDSEFYTYDRRPGESDVVFVARVVDFLNSEFN